MDPVETADLWTCERCGKRFVQRNMWHSCGDHTVDAFLAGKSDRALAFWERLQELVARCGPTTLFANKGGIGFMVRVRFAGISAISDRGMTMRFWLKERIDHPRFSGVEHYGGRDWGYRLRITSISELDDEVQEWLCRSYRVGCQLPD